MANRKAHRLIAFHSGQRNGHPLCDSEAVDALDRSILTELDADPRLSMAELARRTGVSVPTARDRVRRLEESGVIRGYRLDVDPAALGYPVAAFVRVRPGPGQLPRIAALARSLPQVSECHRITGEDCFLLKVHATNLDTFEEVLDRFLLHGQTTTSIVQSTPVPPRTPVLGAYGDAAGDGSGGGGGHPSGSG
jgi:Lrp/AsnC family leucine-responsive transcriptional regulator